MKKIILIFGLCLLMCGCNTNTKIEETGLTDSEINEIMETNEYVIIDVRTKEEYNEGHVIDSINIPYDEIDKDIDITKENIVFVYCKSGNRSKKAYETLISLGYTVYDLGGYSTINLPKE